MAALDTNTIRNILIQKGFEKVYLVEKEHNCVLFLGKIGDFNIIIGIYSGVRSLYAKIVDASKVLEPYWKCEYLEYVPHGLYTFSNNIDELIEKIVSKAKIIIK